MVALARVLRSEQWRDLLYVLTWREVVSRYKRTVLGVGWALAEPLALGIVYFVVFRYFARVEVAHYPFYLLSGLLPWTFMQSLMSHCASVLNENVNLVKKIHFPREVLALAKVANQLLNLCVSLLLVLVAAAAWPGVGVGLHVAWMVPALVLLTVFAATTGAAVSVLAPYMQDLPHLLMFGFRLGTYATPIIYEPGMVPAQWRFVMWLNPMTSVVELFHAAVVPGRVLDWAIVGPSAGVAAGLSVVSWLVFTRVDRGVAEVL